MSLDFTDDTQQQTENGALSGLGTEIKGTEKLEQILGAGNTVNNYEQAFSGFMMIGTDISNSLNEHYNKMKTLLEPYKYAIVSISEGLEFPILAFAKKVENVVYYYSTVITDDQKRALSLSNFVQALDQRDNQAYTLDLMYEANEDEEVKAKLKALYPSASDLRFVGSSVVRYNEDTYMDVSILINRALEAAPYLAAGRDQTLEGVNKNFKISYLDIPSGSKISRTGLTIRADFRLTLSSNAQVRASRNSTNKDLAYVFGYIDLVPEEELQPAGYGQQPIPVKKLRPMVIITDIVGLSATPGYAYFGILTATNMLNRNMYMGHILRHAAKYNDLISLVLGENVDLNKLTPADRNALMNDLVINPIMALDIANNGYSEEISFMLESNANSILKKSISGFTGETQSKNLIEYILPLPYLEYFDKTNKDGRSVDCANIASITKDLRMVLGFAKITNDAQQDKNFTISDLSVLLNEAGIDGEIIGSYGRIFLSEEGLREFYAQAAIKAEYAPLWEAPQQAHTFMSRQGFSNAGYFSTGFNGSNINRSFTTF